MHNPVSVLVNDLHKLLWDIQTDHQISARRLELIIMSKRIVDFALPANHRIKLKESEKKDKYLNLAWELKIYGTRR